MFSAGAVAFLVAALLVLLLFRLAFGRRLRTSGAGRARQPRLGLVDAFDLDRQRQLIIVRRDNVEHLLMIGGPNDVLIESEIVRAEAAREIVRPRDKEPDLRPALPMPAGAEPVAPPSLTMVPSAAAPFAAPSSVAAPTVSEPAGPVAADVVSGRAVPPINAEARLPAQDNVSAPKSPEGVRAPLFPLPPRRPPPPLPPASARVDPPPIDSPTSAPAPKVEVGPGELPPNGAAPLRPVPSVPPRPPAFLRPPPLRPAPPRQAVPPVVAPPVVESPVDEPQIGPALSSPVTPTPPQTPAAPPPDALPPPKAADPLDSIEEEMAKLLGRASDKP